MRAYAIDGAQGPKDLRLVNNTLVATGGWAAKLTGDLGGSVFLNNVLIGSAGSLCVANAAFSSNGNAAGNVFSRDGETSTLSLAAWRTQTSQDSLSVQSTTTALFSSASDFHLLSTSPARNGGQASLAGVSAPGSDLEGASRPKGTAVDIGAYEYLE